MAGYIWEFFGYRADDESAVAVQCVQDRRCPYSLGACEKTLSDGEISGVCAVKPVTTGPVICCPIRLYAEEYRILRDVAGLAFGDEYKDSLVQGGEAVATAQTRNSSVVAVFGKGWGGELRLPQRQGRGGYFVDWVLALVAPSGELLEFVAVEVQTIDTTGNYRSARSALLRSPRQIVKDTVGLNWENVSKRILTQLIYKGQVLQREALCRKGLFFVCPVPVYGRVMERLGGREALVRYQLQPASITFLAYDYEEAEAVSGSPAPLVLSERHSTTVYRVQEAFNNVTLPDENVYQAAIQAALER